jgi:hypothetical protein
MNTNPIARLQRSANVAVLPPRPLAWAFTLRALGAYHNRQRLFVQTHATMFRLRWLAVAGLGLGLLLSLSCKQSIKSLADLTALRNELMKQYNEDDVNVTVQNLQNSQVLGIVFVNSSMAKLGEYERGAKAKEIAVFARAHYSSIGAIDRIWVSFVESESYVVFHYSRSFGIYLFEKSELTAEVAAGAAAQGVVTASYNPDLNETTVYLNKNLQVYSAGRTAIALFPHFTVPGSNASPERIPRPKSVALDFTTTSDRRLFPDNPTLGIYVDNRRIFYGPAGTTNVFGSVAAKSLNEAVSQEISYDQFVRVAEGHQVKLQLGSREFPLTPEHLEALRAMKRCVEEVRCK